MRVDQGRKVYYKLMQKWLEDNDTLTYSTPIKGKLVIAEMFIKTLKAKIYKKNWQLMIAKYWISKLFE